MGVYTLCSVKKKNGRSIFIFLNTNLEGNIYFSFPERQFGREYLLLFFSEHKFRSEYLSLCSCVSCYLGQYFKKQRKCMDSS